MLALTELELYTPRQVFPNGTLLLDGDKIVTAGPDAGLPIPRQARRLSLPGRKAFPGFIDLHTHGLLGKDAFSRDLAEVIRLLPRFGVTSFLATTVTLPMPETYARLKEMAEVLKAPPSGANCLGIHLEGPHLSPKRTGMAKPNWTRPLTREEFDSLQEAAAGHIKMITFAPEEGDSLKLIPYLLEQGVVASIGHSDAPYELVAEAVNLGLGHATHTFNAMPPFHHREPGVIGAVLAFPEITAQLIADGHHVHPGAMRALLNAKGSERVCLVSDSAPFAGLPAGKYEWEGYTVIIDGQTCRTPQGNLAGAYALLDTGFRTLIQSLGLTPSEAAICASEVPARALGFSPLPAGEGPGVRSHKGRLLPGYDADVVVLDEDYQVEMTIVGGEIVYQ